MIPNRKPNPPFATKEKEGLIIKPFRFLTDNSTTIVPQVYAHYRPPRLVVTPTRKYIEYWYRVPEELYLKYKKEWKRFRVFEDINRVKAAEYPAILLKAVKDQLQNGYNPFDEDKKGYLEEQVPTPVKWSLNAGLDRFLEYCKEKKLRPKTIGTYQTLINTLKEYFLKDNQLYKHLESFTKDDVKAFFKFKRKDWGNTTVNNNISYIKIFFNWFVKEEVIPKSPADALEILPVTVSRHKVYPEEVAQKIKEDIKKSDPELYEFLQMIYYCAARPKEIRMLQVKHILFERELLFVPAHISKNRTDDYIPIGEEVLEMLKKRKGEQDHYIFGGKVQRGANYFANHFKPYKDKYGLGEEYGLYSFKHTRAIELAKAGADPYHIMRLFRHSSLEVTMKYLRDLGLNDFSDIHLKTKKF